jgi:hypothetical protein
MIRFARRTLRWGAILFLLASVVVAVLANDILAGATGLGGFSLGYAVGIVWSAKAGWLPGADLDTSVLRTVVALASVSALLGFAGSAFAVAG